MNATGTQQRRATDPILEEILKEQRAIRVTQSEILRGLAEREQYQRLLEQSVDSLSLVVVGHDGETGIKAKVQKHEDRINQAMGAMFVLGLVGAGLGWIADRLIKAMTPIR